MNGLYLQLHAYMLRVAIPYGTLSARQMRQLAHIAERWDRGYGHFTTRQNIQFNWPKLRDVPDILDALAEVEMHAQSRPPATASATSPPTPSPASPPTRSRIRAPTAELIRQWSSLHPRIQLPAEEVQLIAITGSPNDRAAVKVHDIGLAHGAQRGGRGRL